MLEISTIIVLTAVFLAGVGFIVIFALTIYLLHLMAKFSIVQWLMNL